MMRYLKILFLSMVVIGLMAGTAFAGTTTVNAGAAGANFTASLEAMGSAKNVTIIGALAAGNNPGNAAIIYTAAQPLVSGNLLTVTFANAAFTGAALNICALNSAVQDYGVGNATPTGGSTAWNFQLNFAGAGNAIGAGNYAYLTSGGCGAAAINVPVQLSATTSAVNPTVKIDAITSGGVSIDPSAANRLATISAEYTVVNNSSNHIVDYLAAPGNGTRIISGGAAPNVTADSNVAGVTNSVGVLKAVRNYDSNSAAQNAGLNVAAIVSLQDSAGWQGVSRVYLVPIGTNCTIGANVVANSAPTGTVALAIPTTGATNFNGSATTQLDLCVEANGTSSLQTRTILASVDVNVTGLGPNDPGPGAYANAHLWGLNAYQAIIPWVVSSAVMPTYCLISSAETTRTANVILDVLSSEGSVTLANQSLGSIAPMTSVMGIFTAGSATLGSGTPVSLTTLGTDTRYAPRITVTANPSLINVTCIQTDPISTAKRLVPVLTGVGSPWKQ